jgi:dihydroorotase
MGASNDNIEEVLKTDPKTVCGVKVFMGSSTGNMLVDNKETLEELFSKCKLLIAAHCEDETTIKANMEKALEEYGEDIPIEMHPKIRSAEACYISSSKAIELAKKTGARLHVFHLSTEKETHLFSNKKPLAEKKITAEVCIHHLWFTDEDYAKKGTKIKWNPAVKSQADKDGLWKALNDDRIDVIATDHAPHTSEEKDNVYTKAPSGGPLVQHALEALFEMYHKGFITVEKIVQKTSHNPAILFEIKDRGYIREGYKADLVLINPVSPWTVSKDNIAYHCGWSPFEGTTFKSRITNTLVNGLLVYENGKYPNRGKGERLTFNR